MRARQALSYLLGAMPAFAKANAGNVAITFALALVPLLGAVGTAVDYSRASSIKTAVQSALDAAALATIQIASTLPDDQIGASAQSFFNASFSRSDAGPVAVGTQYNSNSKTITLTGSGSIDTSFMKLFGFANINIGGTAVATVGQKQWQVCVMVTNPDSNHTLLTKNTAQVNFENCMVQVNTQNWDAVESRDTSFIHSTNGENCFVGDIHYGDVVPPKNPTCTFFPDPFASYTVPTNSCDYTNRVVNSAGTTLNPGTYCGGISVSANTTFSPGVYYIQDGDFAVSGSANVTANGVTFVIGGSGGKINITTSGTLTMSPSTSAGQWSGFLFYCTQASCKGDNTIATATLNGSGVIHLVGQPLNITNSAVMTINPGSVIADMILPDSGGKLNLTGTLNSSLPILSQLKKTGSSAKGAILVR